MRAGTTALNTLWGRASNRAAPSNDPRMEAEPNCSSLRRWPVSSRR